MSAPYYQAPMQFAHGFMCGLKRRPTTAGRYGSLEGTDDFAALPAIGPCAFTRQSREDSGEHQNGALLSATLSAPAGTDVRHGDLIQPPGEVWMTVTNEPKTATNAFTGWQPPVRVELSRQRIEGS